MSFEKILQSLGTPCEKNALPLQSEMEEGSGLFSVPRCRENQTWGIDLDDVDKLNICSEVGVEKTINIQGVPSTFVCSELGYWIVKSESPESGELGDLLHGDDEENAPRTLDEILGGLCEKEGEHLFVPSGEEFRVVVFCSDSKFAIDLPATERLNICRTEGQIRSLVLPSGRKIPLICSEDYWCEYSNDFPPTPKNDEAL